MSVRFDFDGRVAMVTGACGTLGSSVTRAFHDAGATVCATDVIDIDDDDSQLQASGKIHFYRGDLTTEDDTNTVVDALIDDHSRLDFLANIAGTWKGGSSIDETTVETFDLLININLKTMFLASKHAIPHLRATGGAIVNVSARSSLEGGAGDGPYRASKAGVRLLTETSAEENRGSVRANAIMPSVIDTPMNREMMPDADHDAWVDPDDIARVILWLCSDGARVTSGAAVPVYGEA